MYFRILLCQMFCQPCIWPKFEQKWRRTDGMTMIALFYLNIFMEYVMARTSTWKREIDLFYTHLIQSIQET